MKRSTLKLLVFASLAYIGFLVIIRGFFSSEFTPPIGFLVVPLIPLILILVSDLASRVTTTSEIPSPKPSGRISGREVQFLTRHVQVATRASTSYFESLLVSRLKELLVERVSLESGMEPEKVRETLADRKLGPALLRDASLYGLLYDVPRVRGDMRVKMLRETIMRIEAWKP